MASVAGLMSHFLYNEAEKQNITGKAVTLFLLPKILDETEGKSADANIALMLNNAKTASLIEKDFFK